MDTKRYFSRGDLFFVRNRSTTTTTTTTTIMHNASTLPF